MFKQTMLIQIKLLLKEFDQGLHCLPICQKILATLPGSQMDIKV